MSTLDQADRQYALHPYTNVSSHQSNGPFIIVKGDGIHIWDDKSNRFLESMAGLWRTSLGFSEKRLAAAAARQFEALPLLAHVHPPIHSACYRACRNDWLKWHLKTSARRAVSFGFGLLSRLRTNPLRCNQSNNISSNYAAF